MIRATAALLALGALAALGCQTTRVLCVRAPAREGGAAPAAVRGPEDATPPAACTVLVVEHQSVLRRGGVTPAGRVEHEGASEALSGMWGALLGWASRAAGWL